MLQEVTLSSSPEGQAGAPRIGRGVLLSAGATVLGNVDIGDGRLAHTHHRRPPSTFPLDGLGCSFFSRSRSAHSPPILFNIRFGSASADVVEMPALCSCLISP